MAGSIIGSAPGGNKATLDGTEKLPISANQYALISAIKTYVQALYSANGISLITAANYADMLTLLGIDTDGTLAANSDTRFPSQKAIKTYVDLAVTGLLDFKGSTDASTNPNYPSASKGDAYVVSVAGKVGGASGKSVDVGDVYLATADNAGGAEAAVGTSWVVLEHNLVGAALVANNLSDLASATTALTNLGLSANGKSLVTAANYAAMKVLLDLEIGVDLQAYDAQLSSLIRQNSQSAAYTTILTDGGKHILHPTADNNARTFTIDSNANVAYPIGTAITFVNQINTVTIAITSDTMTLAGTGTTGSRTLAASGIATALKISTTGWIISGTGLT